SLSLEVLDDVTQEDQVVGRECFHQFGGIPDMDLVVKILVHLSDIAGESFDAVDANMPVFFRVTCGIIFGFVDVGIFAEQMTPFAKSDADVEDRARLNLPKQMNDSRDCIWTTARHGISACQLSRRKMMTLW